MRIEVHSAYVAGAYCANINIPNRQQPLHLERRTLRELERAVMRTVQAACAGNDQSVTVQWHEMRSVL